MRSRCPIPWYTPLVLLILPIFYLVGFGFFLFDFLSGGSQPWDIIGVIAFFPLVIFMPELQVYLPPSIWDWVAGPVIILAIVGDAMIQGLVVLYLIRTLCCVTRRKFSN